MAWAVTDKRLGEKRDVEQKGLCQLVEELKAGERRGCTHLVDAFQGRLMWEAEHVFRLVHEDAEELVSDVLLLVVQKIHCFRFRRDEKDFHFWVMAIFRNKLKDLVRHKALTKGLLEYFDEQRFSDSEETPGAEREVVAAIVKEYEDSIRRNDGGGHESGNHAALERVADVLESMEPWERVLLRCRALDIPYREIAGYTLKSEGQLKVYHARVTKKFIRLYSDHLQAKAGS